MYFLSLFTKTKLKNEKQEEKTFILDSINDDDLFSWKLFFVDSFYDVDELPLSDAFFGNKIYKKKFHFKRIIQQVLFTGWILGKTPPCAIVTPDNNLLSSSSFRIANWRWRGIIRLFLLSRAAFPANSRISAERYSRTYLNKWYKKTI
jgi:hypothetical protein